MIVFSNGLNPPYGRWASLLTPTSFGYFPILKTARPCLTVDYPVRRTSLLALEARRITESVLKLRHLWQINE